MLQEFGTQNIYQIGIDGSQKSKVMDLANLELKSGKDSIHSFITLNDIIKSEDVNPLLAQDILSMGYISYFSSQKHPKPIQIEPQVRKGYVCRTTSNSLYEIGGRTTNVSSFANPKGFSGGPVFTSGSLEKIRIFGISYNNIASESWLCCIKKIKL